MLCRLCEKTPSPSSEEGCRFCDADLTGEPEGSAICFKCANRRQICQRCGRPLRLSDFDGIYISGTAGKLSRSDEQKIISVLLSHKGKRGGGS